MKKKKKSLYTNVCLLKTAIADVSSYTTTTEGHILFDEGAQRSFVTQQLASELQLKPSGVETIIWCSGAQWKIKGTNKAQRPLTRRNPERHIPLVSLLLWHKMVAVHPFVWVLGLRRTGQ